MHLRAVLGLPIPSIKRQGSAASRVILAQENCSSVTYTGLEKSLKKEDTRILIFGKPNAKKGRRMGVAVALGKTIKNARKKADKAASLIQVINK